MPKQVKRLNVSISQEDYDKIQEFKKAFDGDIPMSDSKFARLAFSIILEDYSVDEMYIRIADRLVQDLENRQFYENIGPLPTKRQEKLDAIKKRNELKAGVVND